MTQKVLITGGAGFVGTHLTKKLIDEGFEVIVFDNLSFGKKENIPNSEKVSFIKGDVKNKEDLLHAFQEVDIVVHLAAIVSVISCEEHPEVCHENNIVGTRNVFEIAKELHIKKIIYASSAAVYGNLDSSCIKEDDEVCPISKYGISKFENEKIAEEFSNDINSVGLRFFNIYGPGLSMENAYPSVLVSFFKKIKNNEPLTVFGDGTQTRDFVHVFDISKAIIQAIKIDTTGSNLYNVGTNIETPIITIAEHIQKIKPEVKISFEPIRSFDIKKSCCDITKIKSELHFVPEHSVLNDLEELLNLYTK